MVSLMVGNLSTSNFKMKKIIFKIVVFVSLIVILDQVIGSVFNRLLISQKSGKLHKITQSFEVDDFDIMIFGNSRAVQHYNPKIISDNLGLTVGNMGMDGQSIVYHRAVLEVILERHVPELIILDLFQGMDFAYGSTQFDRLSILLPYANRYPSLYEILKKRSRWEEFKLWSKVYPYNSLAGRLLIGSIKGASNTLGEQGFSPHDGCWEQPLEKIDYGNTVYDSEKIKYFIEFVDLCKKKDVPLFVVISPYFVDCANYFSFSRDLCSSVGIEIHDFSSAELFLCSGRNFKDPTHLNRDGANLYSEFIANKLKMWIPYQIIN